MKSSKTGKNVVRNVTAFIYFCGFMTVAAHSRSPAFWMEFRMLIQTLDTCRLHFDNSVTL